MRIAVIGAGVSGLVAARVLSAVGHDVTAYERTAELGGVWSAARRYPRVSTQDDRVSYAFSDLPFGPGVGLHPSGLEVQEYLHAYVEHHDLGGLIRYGTEVASAQTDDAGWELAIRDAEGERTERADHLVAANGTYSVPYVPDWPGRAEFEAAGGQVVDPFALGDGSVLEGRRVAVVGWGKTACDVAVVAAESATSVALVARDLWWKYPKDIRRGLTFRHLLLTRLGEHVLTSPRRSRTQTWLRRLTYVPRRLAIGWLARAVGSQLGLADLGLHPDADFPLSNSLVTEGFYEAVRDGLVRVHRDTRVVALHGGPDGPRIELGDGRTLDVDVLVPATGHEQQLDFLAPEVAARLVEPTGELLLYRQVLPPRLPGLSFVGWSQTYRSPLSAEIHALWLAGVLDGVVDLPDPETLRRRSTPYQLTRARSASSGAPQIPASTIGDVDDQLGDLGLPLPRRTRLRQLTHPMDPADYAYVLPALVAKTQVAGRRHSLTPV